MEMEMGMEVGMGSRSSFARLATGHL